MDDADCKAVFTPLRLCLKNIVKKIEPLLCYLIIVGTLFSCIMLRTTQTVI